MIGSKLVNIYMPLKDDELWMVLETTSGFYEMRMGGVKKLNNFDLTQYEIFNTDKKELSISNCYTDNENLYFVLSDTSCIVHGFDIVGNFERSIEVICIEEPGGLDDDFFADPDFKEVEIFE